MSTAGSRSESGFDQWERDVVKMAIGWTLGMLAGIALLVWILPEVMG